MYKVMIVDDDVLIRNNVKFLLGQMEDEFCFGGEASNGKEAFKQIEKYKPEIILTDMEMPVMNGVDLTRKVTKNYKNIEIIVLSNYDDYEYVHTSFRYGAYDYLLKHNLTRETLYKALKEAANNMKEKGIRQKTGYVLQQSNLPLLQRKFIINLLTGISRDKETIKKDGRLINIKLYEENLLPITMVVENYGLLLKNRTIQESSLLEFSIINICSEIIEKTNKDNGSINIVHIDSEYYCIIFSFKEVFSISSVNNTVIQMLEKIKNALKKFMNMDISFLKGEWCNSFEQLSNQYRKIEQYSTFRTPKSEGGYENIEMFSKKYLKNGISYPEEQQIKEAILKNNKGQITILLSNEFQKIKEVKW